LLLLFVVLENWSARIRRSAVLQPHRRL
jgi:hypothetical protein